MKKPTINDLLNRIVDHDKYVYESSKRIEKLEKRLDDYNTKATDWREKCMIPVFEKINCLEQMAHTHWWIKS